MLPRVLSLFDFSVLSSASMGPAYSLAATMGPMVAVAGRATPVALLALTAIMLCIAIGFARLSRIAPNAGSSYAWIRNAFGIKFGAYGAWLLILSNFFATMATAIPAGIYTLDLLAPTHAQNPLWDAAVGALWIIGSAGLLYAGVRPTALVTTVALLSELGVLALSAVVAALHSHHSTVTRGAGNPIFNVTLLGFLSAMTLGIWMTDGWEVSASTSEEARARDASGRGGIAGLILTSAILCGCISAYMQLGTVAGFTQNAADSMTYVATLLGGRTWRTLIVTVVLISTCAALWTTLLYLSRSIFAMGRDGLLPRPLGRLDDRSEPLNSLLTVGLSVSACELLTGFSKTAADQLSIVLNASSVFLGLLFAFSAAAAVRTFWNERGFGRVTGVLIPALGFTALLAVLLATIGLEARNLQAYALGGLCLGIPFALWRRSTARRSRAAEQ